MEKGSGEVFLIADRVLVRAAELTAAEWFMTSQVIRLASRDQIAGIDSDLTRLNEQLAASDGIVSSDQQDTVVLASLPGTEDTVFNAVRQLHEYGVLQTSDPAGNTDGILTVDRRAES